MTRKLSEETKKKISQSLKGRTYEDLYGDGAELEKKKRRESNKGKKRSMETRIKMSISFKGKKKPPRSEEHKKALSRANKGQIPWHKGKTGVYSKETLEKMSKVRLERKDRIGYLNSPETRKKSSIFMLKMWSDPEFKKNHIGPNTPNWKGGISEENHKIRNSIEIRLWRETVFARDNWTCQKYGTRSGKLHPHHTKNFSSYPELRFVIDNGITLSEKAHKEFHKIYGYKDNTREQLEEFLNKSI